MVLWLLSFGRSFVMIALLIVCCISNDNIEIEDSLYYTFHSVWFVLCLQFAEQGEFRSFYIYSVNIALSEGF